MKIEGQTFSFEVKVFWQKRLWEKEEGVGGEMPAIPSAKRMK
jgi:hypothetical protein